MNPEGDDYTAGMQAFDNEDVIFEEHEAVEFIGRTSAEPKGQFYMTQIINPSR